MNISLVSLEQIWENKKENLYICKRYIIEASLKGVELIIFPEMTLTAYSLDIQKNAEVKDNSFTIKSFQELAEENNIAIIFGLVIKEDIKATNRLYFIDENGKILDSYKKIHPFSLVDEDKYFLAGTEPKIVKYKNIKFGLTICYDLRFSNLYQYYMEQETDCIINIANWPVKRIDHWNTLLKARAIEYQQYIIGVNRVGIDGNNLEYEESSKIFNANGNFLKELNRFKDMRIFNIDFLYTSIFKKKFNTIQDYKIINSMKDTSNSKSKGAEICFKEVAEKSLLEVKVLEKKKQKCQIK